MSPVLLYDGQCRFCVRQAERLARWSGGRVQLKSFRDPRVLARFPGVTLAACETGMQLVEADGRVSSGAEAGARALRLRPALAPVGWLYFVPGVRQLADRAYAIVARNRFRLGGTCDGDACGIHPSS
jgi:predicted DCC family thiol-disulfide oxidoreductase YuxK